MDVIAVNGTDLAEELTELYVKVGAICEKAVGALGGVGVVLNALVLFVLGRLKHDKPSLVLMKWLAVYDLGLCAGSVLVSGAPLIYGVQIKDFNLLSCWATVYTIHVNEAAGIFCICLLTLDRLWAIEYPFYYAAKASTKLANIASVATLIVWAAAYSPYPFVLEYQNRTCYNPLRSNIQTMFTNFCRVILGRLVPVIFIPIANSVIILRVRQRKGNKSANNATKSTATLMLSGVSAAFTVTYGFSTMGTFYVLFFLVQQHGEQSGQREAFIQMWLAVSGVARTVNAAINFLLYMLANPKFRRVLCPVSAGQSAATQSVHKESGGTRDM